MAAMAAATHDDSHSSHETDWPEELDALRAAPRHHTLLFENESVRVLDTRVPPGDTVPLHTHRWPGTLYIVSASHFVRRDGAGNVLVDSRTRPPSAAEIAAWSEPLPPHTLENVGDSELRVITVELKGR
jgi:quercetin dioxygenase-like cupin family protein